MSEAASVRYDVGPLYTAEEYLLNFEPGIWAACYCRKTVANDLRRTARRTAVGYGCAATADPDQHPQVIWALALELPLDIYPNAAAVASEVDDASQSTHESGSSAL